MSAATGRNILIVLALAAALAFLPGGGTTARFLAALFGLAFLAALAWFAARMYLEHRVEIFSLGDRHRALAYGAVAVAMLTLTATNQLWDTGAGTVVWLVLVSGCSYVLYWVWRSSRTY